MCERLPPNHQHSGGPTADSSVPPRFQISAHLDQPARRSHQPSVRPFFWAAPSAFRLVTRLEAYSRTSGESNHHRQSVRDTRVPQYQLGHEDTYQPSVRPATRTPGLWASLKHRTNHISMSSGYTAGDALASHTMSGIRATYRLSI